MILENLYRDFISKMERRNEKIYNVKVLIKVKLINFFFKQDRIGLATSLSIHL